MDKLTKQRVRKLWRNRLLLGLGGLLAIGIAGLQFQSFLRHRPQHPSWTLDFLQAIEEFSDEKTSSKRRNEIAAEIYTTASKRNLRLPANRKTFVLPMWKPGMPLVRGPALEEARIQVLERARIQVLEPGLPWEQALMQAQARERERQRARGLALPWEREQDLDLAWELTQELTRALTLAQAQELERERELTLAQELYLSWELRQDLELELTRAQEQVKANAIQGLNYSHDITLPQDEDLDALMSNEPGRARDYALSALALGISLISLTAILLLLNRSKGLINLPPSGHMIAFLPEECVAEMGVVYHRMKKANASPWAIRWRMTEEFVTLLWVFYIRVPIDNFGLPPGDRSTDD